MTIAEQLSELPAGFSQTNELIAKLDSCINTGFSRLTPDQNAGLAECVFRIAARRSAQ